MSANLYTHPQNLFREFTKATNHIKKAARQKTALLLILAATGIASTLNPQQTTAQTIKTDTIYGNGIILTYDSATKEDLGNVTLYLRPDKNSKLPDTTYTLKVGSDGMTYFNLPISIDTITTGIKQYKNQKNVKVWPNPANGFNTQTTKQNQKIKEIKIIDLRGREVKEVKLQNNTSHTFTSLKGQPDGTYLYAIKLSNGTTCTGKFQKTARPAFPTLNPSTPNASTLNPPTLDPPTLDPPTLNPPTPTNQKTAQSTPTAPYWIKWIRKGYKTDSTEAEIQAKTDWSQIINLYLNKKAPLPPGTITYPGTIRDMDSLIPYDNKGDSIPAPLKGVKVYITDYKTGKIIAVDTTNEKGEYTLHKIPQNTTYVINIGNKEGYYSFGGIIYTTPGNIKPGTDSTIRNVFNTALPRIRITKEGDTVPASYIADQDLGGTVMGAMIVDSAAGGATLIPDTTGEIKYQFTKNGDREYTEAQKDTIIAKIQRFIKEEGNNYKIKIVNKLPRDKNGALRTGILISPGSNATNPSQTEYKTLLGEDHPTIWAKMHLVAGDYKGVVHEMKRALGFDETSYTNSVMNQFAKVYTEADKEIGKLSRKYHQYEHRIMPHTPKNETITNPSLGFIRARAYTTKK